MSDERRTILISGAGGYLGTALVRRLKMSADRYRILAFDVRDVQTETRQIGVEYLVGDVRDIGIRRILRNEEVDTVVHLASIVNPGGPERREFERSVDVDGTENVLAACVECDVQQIVVTSSGAAYGYHANNPIPLRETDALRGNPEFAYADHKRQIEERLAVYRQRKPDLRQLVFRPGTILGKDTDNQITRLFQGACIAGVAGFETPFVFIWDDDVIEIIVQGIERKSEGVYNLAGDGVVTLREIARMTGKPYVAIPALVLKAALWMLRRFGRTTNGPEQVVFLQYRPVLANEKLKREFGYVPRKTSREAFAFFWDNRRSKGHE